eukprot:TRINITY_DN1937_c0_g1_i1.p1 TRINITY_DN1937_c0_g1~~TRINITY_DN1937_c0_g1_i1.p1  ORF type:complete len:532 (+),score=136.87 TRINITY_DN1937_c0_g1_i1:182-1777(+)
MFLSFAVRTTSSSLWMLRPTTSSQRVFGRLLECSSPSSLAVPSLHSRLFSHTTKSLVFPKNTLNFDHSSTTLSTPSSISLLPSTCLRGFATETLVKQEDASAPLEILKQTLGSASALFQPIPESLLPLNQEKKKKKSKEEEIVWATARRRNVRISMKKLVPIANQLHSNPAETITRHVPIHRDFECRKPPRSHSISSAPTHIFTNHSKTISHTQIRGLNYMEALAQLKFSRKTVLPPTLIQILKQARGNAVDKYGWDPSRLIVDIQVGKGRTSSPRIDIRARGKHGLIRTAYSHITIGVRPIPVVEGESRVGKAGLTHKAYPEKLLSHTEKLQKIKEHKQNKIADREARLQRGRELQQKAQEESRKRLEARKPGPEDNYIESMIPIRRKLTLRDITMKPKRPDVKEMFRELYKDDMDEKWMQEFKAEYLPISNDKFKAPVTLSALKKLPGDIAAARERIKRSKEEFAAEVEKKKKQREEFAANLEKLDVESKQKKAKGKADRDAKKKEEEEKEKALREKLAKLRANKTNKQ